MAANQNVTQLTQQTGSAAASSLFYAVTGGNTDTGLPLSVLVNNLGLTGIPTAPTPGSIVNTTQIITGAYAQTFYAPLASPTFTGTPTLPTGTIGVTQTAGNSSTALATTAFVATSFAPLASPNLTGTPLAPTAATGTATTQVATTAFVSNTFAAPPSYGSTTPAAVHATTISATGLISPSTTIGIVGTTLADNAQAGSIGEYVTATTASTAATTGVTFNATSISLTAGDWDVIGIVTTIPAGTTTTSNVTAGISTTTAAFSNAATGIPNVGQIIGVNLVAGAVATLPVPVTRINVSTTTTVYLAAQVAFATSTMSVAGFIRARRVR